MIFDLQKANMLKRISAFIFDFLILITVIVGVAAVLSAAFGFDAKVSEFESFYDEYEERYNIDISISNEEYSALPEEEKAKYIEAETAFENDERVRELSDLITNLTLLITALSILAAFMVLEFAVPLFFKNGQTLGKKIFGIGVMRDDGVRITPMVLFARSILGKCTVETMVPLAIVMLIFLGGAGIIGLLALLLILVFQVVLMIRTKTNSAIHDILAYTVTVDMASQMIFNTREELIAYKERVHAEAVEKSPY